MAEVELGYVNAADPATDGNASIVRRTAIGGYEVEQINASQVDAEAHGYTGGLSATPDDPEEWIETRGLLVFDFSEVREPYEVIGMRGRIFTLIRHNGPATLQAFGYQGAALQHPFDVTAVFPEESAHVGGWGNLSGNPNVITPTYDIDDMIQANGGSISPNVNIRSWTTTPEDAPTIEWEFTDTSWADGRAGTAAGIVLALAMNFNQHLDPAFPNAGTNPHNRFDTFQHVLIVDTGEVEPVEIAASGVIQLTGSAGIAPPPRRPRFHRARWIRDRRG